MGRAFVCFIVLLLNSGGVDVLAVRHIGGEAWVQVQLETERCGRELQGVKAITGWIPSYTATRPSLWFYARGC